MLSNLKDMKLFKMYLFNSKGFIFLLGICLSQISLSSTAVATPKHSHTSLTQNVLDKFQPYRAIYNLTLENRTEKSDVTSLTGRMVYEFEGNACEGWKTKFRFLTQVDMKDEASRITDKRGESYESADGKNFRFKMSNFLDGEPTEIFSGSVTRTKKGLEVALEQPDGEIYKLPNAVFPVMQMQAITKAALEKKHFIKMPLFDGSDTPDDIVDTTVIVGDKRQSSPDDKELKLMGDLSKKEVWPVTISYFNDTKSSDGLPSFRTEFLLYENGITRNLFMDYGDFSVRGKLVHLDLLPEKTKPNSCK